MRSPLLSATKQCRSCRIDLEMTEFYRHPETRDGYLNHCKQCVRGRVRRRRAQNIDEYRERDRQRPGRAAKKRPEQAAAHAAVRYAIQRGDLVRQPCEKCGTTEIVDAHHDDYAEPLEVRWLCRRHHREEHMTQPDLPADWFTRGGHSARCKRLPGAPDPAVCELCRRLALEAGDG